MTGDDVSDAPVAPGLSLALADASTDKRLDVLRQVAAGRSISQAAREVGVSYKAAWQAIDTLTNLSGQPLVDRTVGGLGGGGARITPQGLQLLALADALQRAREAVLAGFEGPALGVAGLSLQTSMRNQLPCTVVDVEGHAPDDPTVRVNLRTAGGGTLQSSVTRESVDLLGLRRGLQVIVLCKATAVAIEPFSGADVGLDTMASDSELDGVVERIAPGAGRDEVVLSLRGGGQWVGFGVHPFGGAPGSAARARMAHSALALALPR